MARAQGTTKTGGRRKGTPNRKTGQLADQLASLGIDVPSEIAKALPNLDVTTRTGVLMELMTFLFPKRKAIEHSGVVESPIAPELTKEELKARVEDDHRRLSLMETPEDIEARRLRLRHLMLQFQQLDN